VTWPIYGLAAPINTICVQHPPSIINNRNKNIAADQNYAKILKKKYIKKKLAIAIVADMIKLSR
jgi:hypothetical protein